MDPIKTNTHAAKVTLHQADHLKHEAAKSGRMERHSGAQCMI
jgi:hypothetical protein